MQISAMINILNLLSTTAWLFPSLIRAFMSAEMEIGRRLKSITNQVFADASGLEQIKGKIPGYSWPSEIAESLGSLAKGICWYGDGSILW